MQVDDSQKKKKKKEKEASVPWPWPPVTQHALRRVGQRLRLALPRRRAQLLQAQQACGNARCAQWLLGAIPSQAQRSLQEKWLLQVLQWCSLPQHCCCC